MYLGHVIKGPLPRSVVNANDELDAKKLAIYGIEPSDTTTSKNEAYI